MINKTGKIKIICDSNGEVFESTDLSELSFELIESEDRGMGIERHYHAEFTRKCNDEEIGVEFNLWEYPEGALNYEDYFENGCSLVEKPTFDIQMD